MIRCRSCDSPIALMVQGKAVIACAACRALNVVVSQGSVRVDVAGMATVASVAS